MTDRYDSRSCRERPRAGLLDRRLEFDVAAFYIDWKDIQLLNTVTVQTPLGLARRSLIENAGKASTRGIEASARYRPISALTLGASLSYSNARLDDPAPNVGASAGERIPYSPRFSGTADVDYEFPLGAQLTGRVGASVRYVGARYNYFSQDPVGNVRATMPSYAQFEVSGVYITPHTIALTAVKSF